MITWVALIKESFPWLWVMKELIDMRPNFIPVGVGHSQAPIDMSEYAPPSQALEPDDGSVVGQDAELELEHSLSEDIGGKAEDEEDLGLDDEPVVPKKRKATDVDVPKKTTARPGISAIAPPTDTKKSRTTIIDKFTDAAKAEETTIQRQLDLKKARIEAEKELQVAKVHATAKVQMSKYEARRQMKAEQLAFEKQKAVMEHEFRMAQLRNNQGPGNTATFAPTVGHFQGQGYSHPVSLSGSSRSTGFNTPMSSNNILLENTAGSSPGFGFDNFDFTSSSEALDTNLNATNLQLPFHPSAPQTEDET
jgi:hypothetical protein